MELKAIEARGTAFTDELTDGFADVGESLQEASKLLYDVLQESYMYSRDSLEIEVNGDAKGASSLYNDCIAKIRKTEDGGDKTAFLAMSVLEDTLRKAIPILMIRAEALLDGTSHMLDNIRRLQAIFADNPYKREWAKRSAAYLELIRSIGLDPQDADYSDLTTILDPLTDALTHYAHVDRYSPILAIRQGPPGDPSVKPVFSRHVQIFRTEGELARAVLGCGKENAILFAGVSPTYEDTDDLLSAWYHGGTDERTYNIMHHGKLTEAEYKAAADLYARLIYACVKTGRTLYLVPLRYQRGTYAGPDISDKTKYLYGHRASYAPYQAFYDEPPAAPEDSTFLALPRKGYDLSSIMDRDQKAWLPAFLYETTQYFFTGGKINATDVYLPSERALMAPGGCYLANPDQSSGTARPLPAVPGTIRLAADVPDPADLFKNDYMKDLVHAFGITADDIAAKSREILHGTLLAEEKLPERLKKAALRILFEHVKDATTTENLADAMDQIRARTLDRRALAERILSDACKGFTKVTVKGPDTPTSISDTRGGAGRRGVTLAFWYGHVANGAPPVLFEARPKTSADYAAILGIPEDELKYPLSIYTPLQKFWSEQACMPSPIDMSRDRALRAVDPLMVNLCMTKTEYKAVLKAREGGKKSRKT